MWNRDGMVSRRRLLHSVSGVGAGLLAGCGTLRRTPPETTAQTTTTTPSPDRATTQTTVEPVTPDQFDTVVDVTEAGADTSGETPINSVLDDHLDDNTLLRFPSGRYRLDPWKVIGY